MNLKFKPLAKKYNFKNEVLYMDIPDHLQQAIVRWIYNVLRRTDNVVEQSGFYPGNPTHINTNFQEALTVHLREVYPQDWDKFISFVLDDLDRELTIIQWCLNYYAKLDEANGLEQILHNGGSGYTVLQTEIAASEWTNGAYDLVERVPSSVKAAAEEAIGTNDKLMAAWVSCYGKSPNYKEVVQQSQNVLEELLRDTYLPKDTKAQLGKLIADIRAGKKLSFKGGALLNDSNMVLSLIEKVPEYRGMHTGGTGKNPDKKIAEYVLHTTIYLWGLHQK